MRRWGWLSSPRPPAQAPTPYPAASGQAKVAGLLMDFFKTDPTARSWFLRGEPVTAVP